MADERFTETIMNWRPPATRPLFVNNNSTHLPNYTISIKSAKLDIDAARVLVELSLFLGKEKPKFFNIRKTGPCPETTPCPVDPPVTTPPPTTPAPTTPAPTTPGNFYIF